MVDLVFQQRRVPYTIALEVGGWEVIKQYVAMCSAWAPTCSPAIGHMPS